jgi:hypothetical protein
VLSPNAECGFSSQSALGDLQWYQFVPAFFKARLGLVIRLAFTSASISASSINLCTSSISDYSGPGDQASGVSRC